LHGLEKAEGQRLKGELMSVTIVNEYRVKMQDGSEFFIYSARDLSALDSTLRYCTDIQKTGRAGLGSDGHATHDGVEPKAEG
jgi:hypothetical protein